MRYLISLLHVIYKGLTENDLYFKEIISNYEEYHSVSHISPMSVLRINLISEWIEPNSSVLDVGCGEGFTMEFLQKNKNCYVKGIDVSKSVAEKLVSKGFEVSVRNINQEGLGLAENEKYDYILFIEVLEHLQYPHRVLIEACKHSKRGVIVTLPNTGYLYWRLQMIRGYFPRQSFTHLHFWSINDFHIFLKQLNLRPLAFKTELPSQGTKSIISRVFQNLLAYQQCWLIAPISSN